MEVPPYHQYSGKPFLTIFSLYLPLKRTQNLFIEWQRGFYSTWCRENPRNMASPESLTRRFPICVLETLWLLLYTSLLFKSFIGFRTVSIHVVYYHNKYWWLFQSCKALIMNTRVLKPTLSEEFTFSLMSHIVDCIRHVTYNCSSMS